MKTIVSFLLVILGGFSTITAQNTSTFQFETEVIDYGEIPKGSDGVRVFRFENIGDAPLIIDNVYASCGCAVPSWSNSPIPPGGTGEIEVKYDTSIVGPIRRTITIDSNTDEPTKAVKIKGKVLDND